MAHHPIIQKEMDEIIAKIAIGPLTGGAGFYSYVFVVPYCTGGLWPILNLKWLNCYMHIPAAMMPTIRQIWELIPQSSYVFSIDLKDEYLHLPIV